MPRVTFAPDTRHASIPIPGRNDLSNQTNQKKPSFYDKNAQSASTFNSGKPPHEGSHFEKYYENMKKQQQAEEQKVRES